MKKKLSSIVIVTLLLITILPSVSIAQIETNKENNDFLKISDEGTPDLIIVELRACWSDEHNGIFIRFNVENIGETYSNQYPIFSYICFFADNNSQHFGYVKQYPLIYPNFWYHGEKLGGSHFFKIDERLVERPELITAKADCFGYFKEFNEDNNELNTTVIEDIAISGYVKDKKGNPIENVFVDTCNDYDDNVICGHDFTDENGFYSIIILPLEPLEESFSYSIEIEKENYHSQEITTPNLKAGDFYNLNFDMKSKKSINFRFFNLFENLLKNIFSLNIL